MFEQSEKLFCNKCGKELDLFEINGDYTLHRRIGYGSRYDGETISLLLCCNCLDELIESCKIPPITEIL